MKFAAVIVLLVCVQATGMAQSANLVRVRAGHSFKEEFPPRLRYRYPDFQQGKIYFGNGKSTGFHPFNYDILFGSVAAIQPNGDTIMLVDKSEYKFFQIKDAVYYRAKKDKYVEVIAGNEYAQLATYEKFIIKRHDRVSNDNYATYVDQTNSVRSLVNMGYGRMIYYQDLLMMKNVTYFLVDKDGYVYRAKRSKFLRVFSDHKKQIQQYLSRSTVDFKSGADLMHLFEYCSAL